MQLPAAKTPSPRWLFQARPGCPHLFGNGSQVDMGLSHMSQWKTGGISWDFTGFVRHPIAGHGWPRFQPATLLDFQRMRVHVNVSCRDHGICIALGSLEDSSVCLERSMVTWALITGPIGLSSSAILGSYQRLAADNTATCTYLHNYSDLSSLFILPQCFAVGETIWNYSGLPSTASQWLNG